MSVRSGLSVGCQLVRANFMNRETTVFPGSSLYDDDSISKCRDARLRVCVCVCVCVRTAEWYIWCWPC